MGILQIEDCLRVDNMFKLHKKKVSNLIKNISPAPNKWCISRGGITHSLRSFKHNESSIKLDLSDFNEIVYIDPKKLFIYVEPNVRMDDLINALLPLRLRPQIIPEFKGITIGGAIQGLAAESSSLHFGLFHKACLEYEVLIGTGEVLTANANQHADLFHAIPGSYGSLGIITMVKLAIVECQPYVLINCTKRNDSDFNTTDTNTYDYLDGIKFDADHIVTLAGKEISHINPNVPYISNHYWFSEWYNEHVLCKQNHSNNFIEIMPIRDYFFRYDRGSFWMASYKLKHTLFNRIIYGKYLTSDEMYKRTLLRTQVSSREVSKVIQDIMIPENKLIDTLSFLKNLTNMLPLWILPIRNNTHQDEIFTLPANGTDYINIGIYGIPHQGNAFDIKREIELYLLDIQGRMVLHSECYYTRNEFWKVYNEAMYHKLRIKYDAELRFVDIYDKVCGFYQTRLKSRK